MLFPGARGWAPFHTFQHWLLGEEVLVAVGVSFWHVHGRWEGLFVCEQGRWGCAGSLVTVRFLCVCVNVCAVGEGHVTCVRA